MILGEYILLSKQNRLNIAYKYKECHFFHYNTNLNYYIKLNPENSSFYYMYQQNNSHQVWQKITDKQTSQSTYVCNPRSFLLFSYLCVGRKGEAVQSLITSDRHSWEVRGLDVDGNPGEGKRNWGSRTGYEGNWLKAAKSKTCLVVCI